MKPLIQEKAKTAYAQLLVPTHRRKADEPDDYLRGMIAALKWVVEYPEHEMDEAAREELEQERMAKQAAAQLPLFGDGRPAPEGVNADE